MVSFFQHFIEVKDEFWNNCSKSVTKELWKLELVSYHYFPAKIWTLIKLIIMIGYGLGFLRLLHFLCDNLSPIGKLIVSF